MIAAFALLIGVMGPGGQSPIPVPSPQWVVTDRIASVRFDCRLSDLSGTSVELHLIKSGRQLVLGGRTERDGRVDDPVLQEADYLIASGSDERFLNATRYVPGGRTERPSVGDRGDLAFLNEGDVPVALLRFPKGYPDSKGVPIVAFLPQLSKPNTLETLAGVCLRMRLEDKQA